MIPKLGAEPVTLACVNRAWESEAGRQQVKGWGRGQIFFVYMQECLPELGVVGELAWLFCTAAAAACAAFTAVLAAYRLASSWNLPIFFLYRILLLPNQLDTCVGEQKEEEQRSQTSSSHSTVHWAVWLFQDVMFGSIKYPIPSPCSNVRRVHKLIKP